MSAEFYLKTLGVPRLTTIAGSEIKIRVRKHLAVLIVLAVEGGKLRRDRLISMLWPTSRPDRARGSLATAISFLRGKLGGDAIEPGRDYVELTPGLVAVDLDRLEKGEILGDDFTPLLEVDGFLNGFEIEGLPEFENWRDRQNARLLPSIEQALVTLTENARRSGDLGTLARHADRLLQLNDLSEWGIKARMEAYALSGDRITALRVYDTWVERLTSELGATPARQVEDLASRLRRRTWDRPVAERKPPPVRTEQWRDRVFVGRAKEYRELYTIWESAKRNGSKHAMISGDSGVGKTTLADWFATAIALDGASVARIRCFELEKSIPYSTIAGVIEGLLERPGAVATSPEALAELSRSIPHIRKRFPHIPPPPEQNSESARIRFAEATVEFFHALMEEDPLLIVIDDFDQADPASLAVLHVLMRRCKNDPIMVLLTSRKGRPVKTEEVLQIRADADCLHIAFLEIEPLTEDECQALFDALVADIGVRPSPTERRALLAAAAGFPLAVELLVRDWCLHGTRSTAIAIQAMTREVMADPEARYQQLTDSLFSDFQASERVIVQVAAILDRRVGDFDLYKVAGVGHGMVLGTLSKMVERRALRDGPRGLEWINPAVRAHAYLQVPSSVRGAFHESIAAELIRQEATGATISRLEIAWHCMRAGRTREASAFLISGAMDAVRNGVPHEAELALLSALPGIHQDFKDDATLALGEVLLELSRPEEALTVLGRIHDAHGEKALATELLLLGAKHQLADPTEGEQEREWARILEVLRSASAETRVLALSVGATLIPAYEPTQYSETLLEASHSIESSRLKPQTLITLLSTQARLHYIPRRTDQASGLLNQALQLAQAHGVRGGPYLFLLNGMGASKSAAGSYEESLSYAVQLHRDALRTGNIRRAAMGASNAAMCSMRLGRYDEALEWAERTRQLVPVIGPRLWLGEWAAGIAAAWLGDTDRANLITQSLVRLAEGAQQLGLRQMAYASAADIAQTLGDQTRALQFGMKAVQDWGEGSFESEVPGKLARWRALSSGDVERVETLRDFREVIRRPLDKLDRAEILCSIRSLGGATNQECNELQETLALLPAAITKQLSRLGVLNDWQEIRSAHLYSPSWERATIEAR